MIIFKPQFPDSFIPFFDSPAAREASEETYDRYCEVYFENLGKFGKTNTSAIEAKIEAEHQSWYAMALTLQRMIAFGGINV